MQAYVDDSRSDQGEQRLVLAGYINTAERWSRFSNAWYAELRRSPSIDYFKMVEAAGLRGQFGGWSTVDRDNKVEDLARIIRHWEPASIHSSVSQKLVAEIVKPVAPYGMASAYSFGFEAIMIPLAIHQSKQKDLMQVPIDFIFDHQEGLGDAAKLLYQSIRARQPRAVQKVLSVEPVFRDDKLIMPLQAADMLAWHIRKHFESGDPDAFPVPPMLSANGMHSASDIPEWYLRRAAEQFSNVPGASTLSDKKEWKKYRNEARQLGMPTFPVERPFGRENAIDRFRKFLARLIAG
ncbi:DUF3800 domain-containing protein [Bradyrhizobium sp. AZCC 1678]|uniref:DUF3800 domain-containing protein n=1 Tax=Bradyrhizobium sp. AZCC 1678 TaxID=3117030 RepID=UPI002FF2CBC9